VRIRDLAKLDRDELFDLVAEAWLTRAQKRVATAWLAEQVVASARERRRATPRRRRSTDTAEAGGDAKERDEERRARQVEIGAAHDRGANRVKRPAT